MMPHCPSCHAEYPDGRVECVDCGVALVEDWEEEERNDEEGDGESRYVLLRNYPTRVHAEMVQEALTQEGIPAIIKSDELYGIATGIGSAGQPRISIWVPEDQKDEAKEIADGTLDPL
ncbi:MAG: DUF2007 domain-containing protein [Candidatus Zixiibacteriota bacterium]